MNKGSKQTVHSKGRQVGSKHTKQCPTSTVTREMEAKIMRYKTF